MLRKGFTLIELLVVITIIAILAGAAVPYVRDYMDQARYAKAKNDMSEIANALTRYEMDRGVYTATTTASLVGPYIQKAVADPWGGAYHIYNASSTVVSAGEDGDITTLGDNITVSFRPALSISKVYYEDSNGNGLVDTNDSLIIKFTRPLKDVTEAEKSSNYDTSGWSTAADFTTGSGELSNASMTIKIALKDGRFIPGKDTIKVIDGNAIVDGNDVAAIGSDTTPIKAR